MTPAELIKIGIHPDNRDATYKRIGWHEYFMEIAKLISKRSLDAETQHGCVAVRNNIIIGTGYNSYPSGARDNILPNLRKGGFKYPFINHSESSLIYTAARNGVALDGCTIYITGRPCFNCARQLISVGITDWIIGDITHVSTEIEDLHYKFLVESHNVRVREYKDLIASN